MLTLYTRGDDARSHRVRIVLAEKGLDARLVEVDPARPPEDLIDLNPYQTIPTLVDRDVVVYEPGIICEYLDERYPHPSLASTDPASRAQARVALRRIEQDWYAVADALVQGAGDRRERDRARRLLAESVLASEPLFRMRHWFLSDQFSQLDAAVAPILWRLPHWDAVPGAAGRAAPAALERYAARVFARPSFARSLTPAERALRPAS